MKKPSKNFLIAFIPGIISGIFIVLFLTGKIIEYPRGTQKGGLIGGLGVLLIIVSVIMISYIIARLKKHFSRNLNQN